MRATIITTLTLLLAGGAIAGTPDAIVPDDFGSIQGAVLGATDSDGNGTVEIFVRAGTYNENILIRRADVSVEGEGASMTTIAGVGPLDTVRIEDSVRISLSGFTVTSDGTGVAVKLEDSTDCVIRDNTLTGARRGLSTTRSHTNRIESNTIADNGRGGMKLGRSNGNTVSGNMVMNNLSFGIGLDRSFGNTVSGNTASNNLGEGVGARRADDNVFENNTATGNTGNGLRFRAVVRTRIVSNDASGNGDNGMRTRETTDSLISLNHFDNNNEWGIRIRESLNDDFDAAAGIQAPPGDNSVVGNLLGPIREDD